eukprot:TRINITY_DN13575_c0_g1_i6.p1 TRINITY_DN13575_c0_g1~~TRINITY_DN13575_c0_g1_i6.p1  ORF type:complete len:199 (+),score=36.83 TRINITY_DN13575_c0_g1_i6:70-666(+)
MCIRDRERSIEYYSVYTGMSSNKNSSSTAEQQKTVLRIKALTWMRDSHGLFDYETLQAVKNSLSVSSECTLIRRGTEVSILDSSTVDSYSTVGTIQLRNSNSSPTLDKYYIQSASKLTVRDNPLDKLWLVAEGRESGATQRIALQERNARIVMLKRGDVVKLGRVVLRVRDLRFGGKELRRENCEDGCDVQEAKAAAE